MPQCPPFQAIFGTMVVKNPSERLDFLRKLDGQAWILMLNKIKSHSSLERLVASKGACEVLTDVVLTQLISEKDMSEM